MKIYRITNITDTFPKRNGNYNKTILLTYVDSMEEKYIELKPGASVNLNVAKIPLSVHQNRINGMIIVTQLDSKELKTKPRVESKKPQKKMVESPRVKKTEQPPKPKQTKKSLIEKTKTQDDTDMKNDISVE